jgi:hypothetical protein
MSNDMKHVRYRAMHRLTSFLFFVLAFASPADAEPASMHCDGDFFQRPQPYFVTYDLQTNHFVFEHPGRNILSGEIVAASDERLDLSLSVVGGRIFLAFDRKRHVMTWPGLPTGELGRAVLYHTCTAATDRTMLSMFRQPEQFDPKRLDPVDAFSLSCPGNTVKYYFITLDRAAKVVVLETEAQRILSGDITGIDDGIVKFKIGEGPSRIFELLWDERSRSLTWIGIANDPTRPTKVQECIVTKPRSIMEIYAKLSTRWR